MKPTMWFTNLSETNRAVHVQALKTAQFGFKKKDCNIPIAKTKALVSFTVTNKSEPIDSLN